MLPPATPYLDGGVVVAHADAGVAVPADVHGGVGAVLDLTIGRQRRPTVVVRVVQALRRTCTITSDVIVNNVSVSRPQTSAGQQSLVESTYTLRTGDTSFICGHY